ncbi:hypothetical protein [Gellertiella hungarica]|uniref:Uncharacterized protein n=1 Tax=Gellertiella hungarica TaxID=1572859 RepID=A0A7W6NKQ4_9HYPH|nr:hypothetical protein [Gellertiella hungarica]MBB4064537.1 hypothetical protein [Gellertiella hungarica]
MARARPGPGPFNDDLLDDGVIRPRAPAPEDAPVQADTPMLESYEVRLERLRAEIQLGLDDYEAGRCKVYSSAAELYADIMSMAEDEDASEGEIAGGDAPRTA